MVPRVKAVLAVVAIGATLGVAAGCGGSSADEAETPANAPTVVNSAPQTDSTGKTVPAPGASTSATTTGGGEASGGGGASGGGDVAAGKAKFDETCSGCHTNGGQQAGVGPKRAGLGLAKTRIEDQIKNGGGVMPAGLVSGTDLQNVVAYVLSIQ
jgi:cytochrome c551